MVLGCLVSAYVAHLLVFSCQPASADVFDELDAMKEKTKDMQAVFDKLGDQQKKMNGMLGRPKSITSNSENTRPRSCLDYLAAGYTHDTLYTVWVGEGSTLSPVTVFCNMTLGGYIPFLRRDRGPGVFPTHFTRDWTEYEDGFGEGLYDDRSEFWLGLRTLHRLTSGPLTWQLRVDVTSHTKGSRYRLYEVFRIAGPEDKYRLTLSAISQGNIWDALMYYTGSDRYNRLDGMEFSTVDRDNDKHNSGSCIKKDSTRGGWWYNACSYSDLTSLYTEKDFTGKRTDVAIFGEFNDIRQATVSIRPSA